MIAVYELSTGNVLRYVQCPRDEYDLNVAAGESCVEVDAPLHTHCRVVDGQLVEIPVTPSEISYAARRRSEYPSVGDQLDAIWKALSENPSLLQPEAQSMLHQIVAVKQKYPKP